MKRLSFQRLGLPSMLLLFCCAALSAQEQTRHNFQWNHSDFSNSRNPCKVFIGVGTSIVSGGLKVDYTVDNTPATTYGVQAGDVIVALDGVPVGTQTELIRERNKHQQGEAFTLSILRDGKEIKINARFKECSAEELEEAHWKHEKMETRMAEMEARMEKMHIRMAEKFANMDMKERPILGVYEDTDVSVPGMVIKSVISGKGAEAAGLQAGDVVTAVDGKTVTGGGTLRTALAAFQPGEQVTVVYQRNGQTLQTEVRLGVDRNYFSHKTERDPCKVFIGIYTSDNAMEGRGARVTGVIDDTPAKQSGVQPGDVIVALDGVPVNTHFELLRERNKHKPGDAFRLTVLRDGATLDIDATFKSCETPGAISAEEKVEVLAEDKKAEQREEPTNLNGLSLEVLEAYPNPTFGPLNVRFEAEAVPTTVRIMDSSGKAVYTNVLNQFNGSFNEKINLFGNTAGTFILTVQQGNKTSSKKIVLIPGA